MLPNQPLQPSTRLSPFHAVLKHWGYPERELGVFHNWILAFIHTRWYWHKALEMIEVDCRYWSESSPGMVHETPLCPEKLMILCRYSTVESLICTFLKTEMLSDFFISKRDEIVRDDIFFQQYDATCKWNVQMASNIMRLDYFLFWKLYPSKKLWRRFERYIFWTINCIKYTIK